MELFAEGFPLGMLICQHFWPGLYIERASLVLGGWGDKKTTLMPRVDVRIFCKVRGNGQSTDNICYREEKLRLINVRVQDAGFGRFWTYFLPQIQWIYSYMWTNSLLQVPENLLNTFSITQNKMDHTKVGRRVRDMLLPETPCSAWLPTTWRDRRKQKQI